MFLNLEEERANVIYSVLDDSSPFVSRVVPSRDIMLVPEQIAATNGGSSELLASHEIYSACFSSSDEEFTILKFFFLA